MALKQVKFASKMWFLLHKYMTNMLVKCGIYVWRMARIVATANESQVSVKKTRLYH